ncbi:Receptor-type tyrosine-protein phosphatase zeta [Termitomyces sp. T112]|nr:Receptor-type tyrosine-protein phosphatase zeta [Termitomyces sp. T112]
MDLFSPAHHRPAPVVPPDVHPFSPNVHNVHHRPRLAPPFAPVLPIDLPAILDDPRTLVLDIRPHAAHADARLPRALSLSVPSTLLKRPLFSLERLAEMLHSSAARHRFLAFNDSARILVYDADSNIINESSNIYGLLRKFRSAHFTGDLIWLRGGFQAVWREHRQLVDSGPHPEEHDDDDTDDTASAPSTGTPILCTRRLPMSAFGPMSTTLPRASPLQPALATNPFFDAVRQNTELSHGVTERIPLCLPNRVRKRISDLPFPWLREIAKRADRIPRPQVAHPRTHINTQGQTSHAAFSQSRPLSRISRDYHSDSPSSGSLSDSSESDTAPSTADIKEGTEALAMQFYRIEVAEQRRLMGVMEHHSKESRHPPARDFFPGNSFPFSITAGVEKGSKNRYRHIWPFEHARVKLCQTRREGKDAELDDYVNASFVQPLGTTKKYIATQGPLEATFEDFWRLTWQQNVHVIVMLTQEVENSMVKCGTYWADSTPATRERTFGMLRVTLVSKVGLPGNVDLMLEEPPVPAAGFGFGVGAIYGIEGVRAKKQRRRVTTIKRTFRLEHRGYPNAGPREVVQLQYLEWPDMNVPEDARGVLGLVREVEKAVKETGENCESPVDRRESESEGHGEVDPLSGVARHVMGGRRPVLLHCSAGVGRTGCFIALDAVLDGIRREVRGKMERERREEEMDVDTPEEITKDALTVPSSVSGQPSPMPRSPSADHIEKSSSRGRQMDDTAMKVEGQAKHCRVELGKSAAPFEPGFNVIPPLPLPHPRAASDGGVSHLPPAMNLSPSSAVSISSESTLASGSVFTSFSDSERGMSRVRGSMTRDGSLATSISSGSVGNQADGNDPRRDEQSRFRTISEPQSQTFSGRAELHLSLGSGAVAGRTPLARSSSDGDAFPAPPKLSHQSKTVDYKEPRALHAFPKTPVALSTFDEPIWEVVQDMREQRMSLCHSLRQYVFMHQVVIEGALRIVDEERVRREGIIRRKNGEREENGKAIDNFKLTASPLPISGGVYFSFGSDGTVISRSNTFPLPGPQVRSKSMPGQPFSPQLSLSLSASNSPSYAGGISSDSSSPASSSTMKRGASPTELMKEGKKGEPLLSKRPSMKRKLHQLKEDTQGGAPATLESVPPSPISSQ